MSKTREKRMKTFVHASSSGKILGVHRTSFGNARIVGAKDEKTQETKLDPKVAALPHKELVERYRWNPKLKKVVKK